MAGHPTVGTGFVLGADRNKTELVFELGVGPTPVTVDPGDESPKCLKSDTRRIKHYLFERYNLLPS
jgi:predicted PhzF superfamily epimerase YddE/YHI9